jgi:flagellar basal-body rod protein FlgC
MGAFDVLRIAGSSLGMHQTWLDALANNIANVNTVTSTDEEPFRAQMVVAGARPGGGVDVAGIALGDAEGLVVNDPGHPLADEDGNVRAPGFDLASQMTQLVMAQRGFQASVQVTKDAQDTYNSALQIGRG